ncbi:MAG: polysaccharide deacetylase family protein [Candidatus Buchananbacteria bacterium]
MKRIIISAIIALIIFGGLVVAFKFGSKVNHELPKNEKEKIQIPDYLNVPILIYHHVDPDLPAAASAARTFYVTPAEFEEQLKYLKENNFATITTKDLAAALAGKMILPLRPVIITFDDGLPSQFQYALPMLEKYNFIATFYIFTNPIGLSKNYLTWEQVKILAQKNMEIGSHTRYHQYLAKETDAEKLKIEIVDSKKKVEEELGQPITAFAYPFGSKSTSTIELIKAAGYLSARDIVNGYSHSQDDLFQLKAYFATSDFIRFKRIVDQPGLATDVAASCQRSQDCVLPTEYAVRSNCPYAAFCENNKCVVACPMWQKTDDARKPISYQVGCQKASDCDCRVWAKEQKFRCACLDNQCVSVIE